MLDLKWWGVLLYFGTRTPYDTTWQLLLSCKHDHWKWARSRWQQELWLWSRWGKVLKEEYQRHNPLKLDVFLKINLEIGDSRIGWSMRDFEMILWCICGLLMVLVSMISCNFIIICFYVVWQRISICLCNIYVWTNLNCHIWNHEFKYNSFVWFTNI